MERTRTGKIQTRQSVDANSNEAALASRRKEFKNNLQQYVQERTRQIASNAEMLARGMYRGDSETFRSIMSDAPGADSSMVGRLQGRIGSHAASGVGVSVAGSTIVVESGNKGTGHYADWIEEGTKPVDAYGFIGNARKRKTAKTEIVRGANGQVYYRMEKKGVAWRRQRSDGQGGLGKTTLLVKAGRQYLIVPRNHEEKDIPKVIAEDLGQLRPVSVNDIATISATTYQAAPIGPFRDGFTGGHDGKPIINDMGAGRVSAALAAVDERKQSGLKLGTTTRELREATKRRDYDTRLASFERFKTETNPEFRAVTADEMSRQQLQVEQAQAAQPTLQKLQQRGFSTDAERKRIRDVVEVAMRTTRQEQLRIGRTANGQVHELLMREHFEELTAIQRQIERMEIHNATQANQRGEDYQFPSLEDRRVMFHKAVASHNANRAEEDREKARKSDSRIKMKDIEIRQYVMPLGTAGDGWQQYQFFENAFNAERESMRVQGEKPNIELVSAQQQNERASRAKLVTTTGKPQSPQMYRVQSGQVNKTFNQKSGKIMSFTTLSPMSGQKVNMPRAMVAYPVMQTVQRYLDLETRGLEQTVRVALQDSKPHARVPVGTR